MNDTGQFGTALGGPLEFVERDEEFARALPAFVDEAEGFGPSLDGDLGEERFVEGDSGELEKLPALERCGPLLAHVVDGGLADSELDDEAALAGAAAAVNGDEGRTWAGPRRGELGELGGATEEGRGHERKRLIKR